VPGASANRGCETASDDFTRRVVFRRISADRSRRGNVAVEGKYQKKVATGIYFPVNNTDTADAGTICCYYDSVMLTKLEHTRPRILAGGQGRGLGSTSKMPI